MKSITKLLQSAASFYVQNEESKNILVHLGIQSIEVTGDTRVDRSYQFAQTEGNNLDYNNFFSGNKDIFIAGSTWSTDHVRLIPFIKNELYKNILFVIAPHKMEVSLFEEIEAYFPGQCVRFTELERANSILGKSILILNTIGHLKAFYKMARWVYIGGGFERGIHNILEPMSFGKPVIFGPKFAKFPEAVFAVENKFGFSISSKERLEDIFVKLSDSETYAIAQQRMKLFFNNNIGATEKIFQSIVKQKLI